MFALADTKLCFVTDPDTTVQELRPKGKENLSEFEDFYCDKEAAEITLVNGSLKISCTENSLRGKCRLATDEDFDKICDALQRYDKDLVSTIIKDLKGNIDGK